MAVTVISDNIEGSQLRETRDGLIDVRRIHLAGLTPGTGIRLEARAWLRQNLNIAIDRPHPNNSTLFVRDITIDPFLNSRDQVWATIVYQTPTANHAAQNVTTFYGTTREEETSFNADGKLIKVKYKDPTGKEWEQIGRVVAPVAYGILEFAQEVTTPPAQVLPMLNKINSRQFQGQKPHTWWCRDIVYQEIKYRPGYRRLIRFEYDPRTYVKTIAFHDANTGEVPADVAPKRDKPGTTGNGYVNDLINGEADFSQLKLPNFFS